MATLAGALASKQAAAARQYAGTRDSLANCSNTAHWTGISKTFSGDKYKPAKPTCTNR